MDEQQEVQHVQAEAEEKRSGLFRALITKGANHPFFSDRTISVITIGLAFLLPIFFIPTALFSPEFSKTMLLEIVIILGGIVWGVARLRDGEFRVPKSLLLLSSLLILIQFIVASVFSPTPLLSLVGIAGEMGTASSIVVLMILMFLSSLSFRSRDRVLTLYAAIILSTVLLLVYHVVRYVFGPVLDFGLFTTPTATPAGKWNDLASFAGSLMLILLPTLYFFPQNKNIRIVGFFLFVVSLFFLIVIDFTVLWVILFALSGIMMILSILEGERTHRVRALENPELPRKAWHRRVAGHIPVYAVILFVISFLYGSGLAGIQFGQSGRSVASVVAQALKVPAYSEVVLTPSYTFNIVSQTLKDSPIVGIGPNRFSSSYLMYKTPDMNKTPFWDASFDYGVGRVPTYFSTTGWVGTIFWLLFIVVLLFKFRKIYPLVRRDRVSAYLGVTLFLLVLYFWSIAFFYLPSISVFALAFLFTGALVSFLVAEGVIGEYHANFRGKTISSFVFTPLIVVVMVGMIAGGVLLFNQASSLSAYGKARIAIGNGNTNQAEINILRAISYTDRDIYQRFLSSLAVLKLQQLVTDQSQTDPKVVLQQADGLITQARSAAERAVALDPTNSENYLSLGGVYDTLGTLGIKGTTDPARSGYLKALELNPHSPKILFLLAHVELLADNRTAAKDYLKKALVERPDFLEAISLLTQLEIQDKNVDGAIAAVSGGVQLQPTNFLLRFALGYLYYANRDDKSAIAQFEAAVYLNPIYADAKYFLGLAYARSERTADAILQFEDVVKLNAENKDVVRDVTRIIENLKAGREPFDAGVSAPSQPINDAITGLDKTGKQTTTKTTTTQ